MRTTIVAIAIIIFSLVMAAAQNWLVYGLWPKSWLIFIIFGVITSGWAYAAQLLGRWAILKDVKEDY